MAEDVFKPAGQLKAAKPDAGGAAVRNVPVFGIVKDNIDPNKSGRIFVYISDNSGKDPDSRDSWTPVSYLSPFYGRTTPSASDTGYGKYVENPSSYGFWNSPPDIGTTVICFFVNGDMNYGFYIGAIPEPEALQMVPAIGATENIVPNSGESLSFGGATRLPVSNINTNNSGVAESTLFLDEPKPVHSFSAATYFTQGLINDPIRGPVGTSAQRESPSRVGWGILTPGRPIYEGGYTDDSVADAVGNKENGYKLKVIARRAGHSIVMDDGDTIGRDQLVRIRSSLGHQILMSDDGQTLFIIHSNGQTYIEFGKEGTIDVYATNSINLRTQGDINFHADRNININAAKDLNIKGENIKVESVKNYDTRVGEKYQLHSLGNYTVKSDASLSLASQSDASLASSSVTYVNGSKINLNTGSTSTQPNSVQPIPTIMHTDTLFEDNKGYVAAPGKLESITSRAPAHTPWSNAGLGVDVTVNLSANDNSPPAGPATLNNLNSQAAASTPTPISSGSPGTMPPAPPVSSTFDTNSTSALLAGMAKTAADYNVDVVQNGYGTKIIDGKLTPVIGAFNQTPKMLENAGIMKPGSSTLLNGLYSKGALPVQSAFTNNLFSGKPGAENIQNLVKNVTAQAVGQVVNLQKNQNSLVRAGVMTGRENPLTSAGVLMSSVNNGLSKTLNTLKTLGPLANSKTSTSNDPVLKTMSTAINAVNTITKATGALSGLNKSVDGLLKTGNRGALLNTSKGVSSSALYGIVSSINSLVPNKPQNLRTVSTNLRSQSASIGSLNTVTNTNALSGLLNPSVGGLAAQAATLASGMLNLPGGLQSSMSVLNRGVGSVNSLPGLNNISGTLGSALSNAFNGKPSIPNFSGANAITNAVTKNLGPGLASQLFSGIAGLTSGGPGRVKTPSVGFNTFSVPGLASSTTNILGDSRIPSPIRSIGPSEAAKSSLQKEIDEARQLSQDANRLNELNKEVAAARQEYASVKALYPAGDPAIDAAKQKWFALLDSPERQALLKKIS